MFMLCLYYVYNRVMVTYPLAFFSPYDLTKFEYVLYVYIMFIIGLLQQHHDHLTDQIQ